MTVRLAPINKLVQVRPSNLVQSATNLGTTWLQKSKNCPFQMQFVSRTKHCATCTSWKFIDTSTVTPAEFAAAT